MNTSFYQSFTRDLKNIKDKKVLQRIQAAIEAVEQADSLQSLSAVKKLSGTNNCFRIRVGEYRIGLFLEGDRVALVRCLPRKDLYRYFR
jgi:mRNA interferase RelE/StbE